MKSITILLPYFGKFPEWFPLYFETLRRNPTIKFIFYTDCTTEGYNAPNVIFNKMTYPEYVSMANCRIKGSQFCLSKPYKLCDLRPWYPIVHYEDIKDADFYGWTDLDLLFGDIRKFYTDDILSKYDVISTHATRISGHLALFRNTWKNRHMGRKIYDWKNKLKAPEYVHMDELGLTLAYTMTVFDKFNEKYHLHIDSFIGRTIKQLKCRKMYLKEQYTTPFIPVPWIDGSLNSEQPDTWFYQDGVITNNRDKNRDFIYIHFMNFKSSQWRHDGTKAPWEKLDTIYHLKGIDDIENGIIIDANGIRSKL